MMRDLRPGSEPSLIADRGAEEPQAMFTVAGVEVQQRVADRIEDVSIRMYADRQARLAAMAPVVAEAARTAESLARLETALSRMR